MYVIVIVVAELKRHAREKKRQAFVKVLLACYLKVKGYGIH